MKNQIKNFILTVCVTVSVCVVHAQSSVRDLANIVDAYTDSSREKREQETAPERIKEIFVLAKKSAEEDFNVNFCGFFTGMSRYDATDLADYYKLKDEEYSFSAAPGKAVSRLWFSLKGVRRITKGGNTLHELAQAVANRVGDLAFMRTYEHKTIDGVVVRVGHNGLTIQNDGVALLKPLATELAAKKDKADDAAQRAAAEEAARRKRAAAEEAARREREAAEEAVRTEKAIKEGIPSIIHDMVAIPGKNFKMGKYEVTQAQWQAVMGKQPPLGFKGAYNPGAYNPIECVSWNDCKKFLEKLNAMPEVKASGLTFRLPTEAEWEYACRAGGTGDYCRLADGTEITKDTLDKVAWYYDNSGDTTHPVGQKEPNAFGLYDMHGNVGEWCEDLHNVGYSNRLRRGGGWVSPAGDCTVRYRGYNYPGYRNYNLGFRLVASQD